MYQNDMNLTIYIYMYVCIFIYTSVLDVWMDAKIYEYICKKNMCILCLRVYIHVFAYTMHLSKYICMHVCVFMFV